VFKHGPIDGYPYCILITKTISANKPLYSKTQFCTGSALAAAAAATAHPCLQTIADYLALQKFHE
jgi:hypothetical protein